MKFFKYSLLAAVVMFQSCNAPKEGESEDKDTTEVASVEKVSSAPREIWSKEQANEWYKSQPWLVGSNFNPSTAINELEMWQASSFDKETIDRELGWAQELGMNTARVYLHDLLWKADSAGFIDRLDAFLVMADNHGIKPLFVLFDSCWDPSPELGDQRDPKPHVHNSGWLQSPGKEALTDSTQYPRLERYVKGVIGHFANDERILGWDVWNEPDNTNDRAYGKVELENKVDYVLPLLKKSFVWARSVNPAQPLTSGVWLGDWSAEDKMSELQKTQISQSDVISFHNYDDAAEFEKRINWLQRYGKPLMCTEYMARPRGSTFEAFLPIARKYNIAMYNWGFVDGKTQTKYPWDSWDKQYTAEPDVWFHEVLHTDGKPYKEEEVALIKKMTAEANN